MAGTNKKPNKFGLKKTKLGVLPIVFSSVLAAGALAGSGVSIWQIAKDYTESPEFTKSVTGRIKIDPAAALPVDHKKLQTPEEAEDILKDCAQKLSRWLKDRGQANYDVSYEFYNEKSAPEAGGEEQYWGYLNAQFELEKIERKHPITEEEEDEKIDNDPYLSFFNSSGFNSNEKTLVYRWYINDLTADQQPKYVVVPFREIFNIPKETGKKDNKTKIMVDSEGNNGVMYAVDDADSQIKFNDIYKNFAQAKKDNEKEDKPEPLKNEWGKPRFYIVNNIEGLYNEVNYHISNRWVNEDGDYDKYKNIYDGTPYQGFAQDYENKSWSGNEKSSDARHLSYHLQNGLAYTADGTKKEVPNLDVFNYIDQASAGTVDANASFTNKYINEIITMDEIDKYIPAKITDDYKNEIEDIENPKINYFWYQQPLKTSAESFLNNQINYGFNKGAIYGIDFSDIKTPEPHMSGINGDSSEKTFDRFINNDQKEYIDPTFTETIFGGSNLVGMLSLGFLIFLIALLVILAALYRTTGVISWICMIFALSMAGLIATVGGTVISMSLLVGLFTMAIAGFMAALAICGRMKRRLQSHEDTQLMIKKTFRKSLLPVVDVSIITLIFGVCLTYIAPISLNALGLVIISGSFMIFLSEYLLNGLLHTLFFNNQIMVNRYAFFGKPSNIANEALTQGHNMVPMGMDATKLELPFYSSMSSKRIDDTGKKALIAVAVAGGLLIVGIILFSVIGYTSSTMFHTSSCIAIYYDGNLLEQSWFSGIKYLTYRHDASTCWWYFYTNMDNAYGAAQAIIAAAPKDLNLTLGSSVLVQNIFGSTSQDILNKALIALVVGMSVTCVYGAIRYNWIAFVPMVATVFAIPFLILGLAAAVQIKFDQFVVMGLILLVIINAIYSASVIGSINESWSRKDAYNREQFKFIINTAIKNCWQYIWVFALGYGLFILSFGLTAPYGVILVVGLMIIGWHISLFFAPFVAGFLLYQFTKVRNFVLRKIVERNKNRIVTNYDEIDEQELEGINKFTKHIPVASETKKEVKNDK